MNSTCRTFFLFLTAVLAMHISPAHARADGDEITRLLHLELPETVTFCGEQVPLAREDVAERLEYEMIIILGNPVTTTFWFKRSPRYFPLIESVIRARGLPEDLKYVALIESDLRADVTSPAGASGPWQFMESTGKSCGLDQDDCMDDRRDWEYATQSALAHLADLKNRLGAWTLALASYNAGEGRISRAMETQGENDFYGLRLPRETERYVFRAIAAKILLEHPYRYGVDLGDARLYRPNRVEAVEVNINNGASLSVRELAHACGVSFRLFREYNPAILGSYLPAGRHRLFIPEGSRDAFIAALSRIQSDAATEQKKQVAASPKKVFHTVKKGETLTSIAKHYRTDAETIRKLNKLKPKEILKAGRVLEIHE